MPPEYWRRVCAVLVRRHGGRIEIDRRDTDALADGCVLHVERLVVTGPGGGNRRDLVVIRTEEPGEEPAPFELDDPFLPVVPLPEHVDPDGPDPIWRGLVVAACLVVIVVSAVLIVAAVLQ
jgi:hypothetical protein